MDNIRVGEIGTLIGVVIGVAREIVRLVGSAQRNREKCSVLKEQVESISALLEELQKEWTPEQATKSLVEKLDGALRDARALVESCQEPRTFSRFFKTQKKAKKFDKLRVRISGILEGFHIANMTLIVRMNKERFFMKVLEKLLRHDACSLLPESEKEELRSYISNLTNTDNMSPDAKRLLEWIIRDIANGHAANTGQSSAPPGEGGEEANQVLGLMDSIVNSANVLRHNRKEIQQLVEFVQKVADILRQHPQASQLWRDPDAAMILNKLEQDLNRALQIVSHNEQHRGNHKITQAFTCSNSFEFEKPHEILKVAYKIEYYVHALPVMALRQMSE